MAATPGWFSDARTFASRWNRRRLFVLGELIGQDLDRHVATEFSIPGPIDRSSSVPHSRPKGLRTRSPRHGGHGGKAEDPSGSCSLPRATSPGLRGRPPHWISRSSTGSRARVTRPTWTFGNASTSRQLRDIEFALSNSNALYGSGSPATVAERDSSVKGDVAPLTDLCEYPMASRERSVWDDLIGRR